MRNVHRWVMSVFAVLLAYWVVTGITLAIVDITDSRRGWANDGGGPGAPTPTQVAGIAVATAAALTAEDVSQMTASALRAARGVEATAPVTAIELSAPNGAPQAVVSFSTSTPRRVMVDTRSGVVLNPNVSASPPGNDPEESLHSQMKNWHRGSVGAADFTTMAPGNLLALLTGAALFTMVITGVMLYFSLWKTRRHANHGEFFWSGGALRHWHRWISIVAAAFILNQSISGTMLAWENTRDQYDGGAGFRVQPTTFNDEELGQWLSLGYTRARQASHRASGDAPINAPIIGIVLMRSVGEPFAPVFFGGAQPGAVGFRLVQNRYIFGSAGERTPGNVPIDLHSFTKRLHRGDIIGSFNGRYLTLASGFSLLWLVGSGIAMYLQTWRQRRRIAAPA